LKQSSPGKEKKEEEDEEAVINTLRTAGFKELGPRDENNATFVDTGLPM
jgi:hypothetical protein